VREFAESDKLVAAICHGGGSDSAASSRRPRDGSPESRRSRERGRDLKDAPVVVIATSFRVARPMIAAFLQAITK